MLTVRIFLGCGLYIKSNTKYDTIDRRYGFSNSSKCKEKLSANAYVPCHLLQIFTLRNDTALMLESTTFVAKLFTVAAFVQLLAAIFAVS